MVDCVFTDVEFIGSFDGYYIGGSDFTGAKGVKIIPSKLFDRCLDSVKLNGAVILGSLDGVYIEGTDFTGSVGVKINPQTIKYKCLSKCNFCNVEFVGSFNGVNLKGAHLEGSNYGEFELSEDNFRTRLKKLIKR